LGSFVVDRPDSRHGKIGEADRYPWVARRVGILKRVADEPKDRGGCEK